MATDLATDSADVIVSGEGEGGAAPADDVFGDADPSPAGPVENKRWISSYLLSV